MSDLSKKAILSTNIN